MKQSGCGKLTPEPLHDPPRLPFRRLLLLPWRWGRWMLIVVFVLALAGYVASYGPVVYLLARYKVPNWAAVPINDVLQPAVFVITHCPPVAEFYSWEFRTMLQVCGPTGDANIDSIPW